MRACVRACVHGIALTQVHTSVHLQIRSPVLKDLILHEIPFVGFIKQHQLILECFLCPDVMKSRCREETPLPNDVNAEVLEITRDGGVRPKQYFSNSAEKVDPIYMLFEQDMLEGIPLKLGECGGVQECVLYVSTGVCVVCTGVCIVCTGVCVVCTGVCIVRTGVCVVCTGVCFVCTGVCIVCTGVCVVCTGVCVVCTGVCIVRTGVFSVCIEVLYTTCTGVLFCMYSTYCKICFYFTLPLASGLIVL